MSDCPRHEGTPSEDARRECIVCLRNLHRNTVRELVRTRRWRCFYQVATIVLAIALFAGCSHTQRRTTSTVATSTAQAEAHREEKSHGTEKHEASQQRKVRAGKTVTPRADGGFDVSWYFDEFVDLAAKVNTESAAEVKVEAQAATEDKSKVDDVKKEPPSTWKLWAVVVFLVLCIVLSAWMFRRLRRK